MSSATATSLVKPLPIATFQVTASTTLFPPKTHFPFSAILSKPLNFTPLSLSLSSFPLSRLSQNIKFSHFVPQASNWEEEENGPSVEVSGDEGGFESSGDGVSEGDGYSFSEPSEEAKVFVANLPFDVDSDNLAQLFNEAGVVETAEIIYNRESNRSRGFGFVAMSTVAEAEKAVEMFNGYDLNGRTIVVNKSAPKGSRVERPPRVFEPSYKAYVGNLSWEVDDARLEEVFSKHGKVLNTRVVFDRETGRSRGFGFVTMSNETELNDAIAALDGQTLDGREIRVNVAENRAPKRNAYSY